MGFPPLVLFSPLMVRSAASRVSNHEALVAHPSRRPQTRAPPGEDVLLLRRLRTRFQSLLGHSSGTMRVRQRRPFGGLGVAGKHMRGDRLVLGPGAFAVI